jgi:hypothetical protein
MDAELALPPRSKRDLTKPKELAKRLEVLVGQRFRLTGKTRTDGSNVRKLVASVLSSGKLPRPAADTDWKCVPPKRKGVPRILREFLDTYIVTTGDSYNLQVWNRNPSEPSVQIEYRNGSTLNADDARFAFVRVHPSKQTIASVVILTPEYIVDHFGPFGKPTVKQQLIITGSARERIYARQPPVAFHPDHASCLRLVSRSAPTYPAKIRDAPSHGQVLQLTTIRDLVVPALLGRQIEPRATKTRGQELELLVAQLLGYRPDKADLLLGGFPDIRHQALEVKLQDAPTVDLGRYSPQFAELVESCPDFTTQSIRYLIALMDASTHICRGVVLCPGASLGEHFTYVADRNFKCQRSIPMQFFEQFDGMSVFNPRAR